jgi:two-component system, chemotaxis family, protein-glutamate methylesterase/glutaminase
MTLLAKQRIVVADDSRLMRRMLADALDRQGFDVVATAADGDEALAACREHRPDALTLDLAMPGLDGLGVLRALRARPGRSIPVVVVSAFAGTQGARAVDALAEGAFDLVAKPAAPTEMEAFRDSLNAKIQLAVSSGLRPRLRARPTHVAAAPTQIRSKTARAVVVATSTGGPRALGALLPRLPGELGLGTLIVQHMPPGFTESLASRLDQRCQLRVREAAGGERLDPGTALLAPGGKHLRLSGDAITALSEEPAVGGLRPRADLLIEDAARIYRERLLLVVLTGMGNDGLRGATAVRRHGGRILVEAEESCTIYGMPRAIVDGGLADEVLSLDRLPGAITAEAGL